MAAKKDYYKAEVDKIVGTAVSDPSVYESGLRVDGSLVIDAKVLSCVEHRRVEFC